MYSFVHFSARILGKEPIKKEEKDGIREKIERMQVDSGGY